MFLHNGVNGPEPVKRRRICFVRFAKWRHRGEVCGLRLHLVCANVDVLMWWQCTWKVVVRVVLDPWQILVRRAQKTVLSMLWPTTLASKLLRSVSAIYFYLQYMLLEGGNVLIFVCLFLFVCLQSTAISVSFCLSVYVCLSLCLSICLSVRMSWKPHVQFSPNFLYMLHVAMDRSSSDCSAMYVMYFRFWG